MTKIDIGSVFMERYRIDDVLGRGAFAKVYRAHQLDLGRDVALKVLQPLTDRPEKVEEAKLRFAREAKLVARLQDPHTIRLFDWGASPEGDMYMAAELVDGKTLHEVWHEDGPMAWPRALRIIVQVLYSLQEAHALGVMHRDIKPANIMICQRPGRPDQVKVLDFGIAKAYETPESNEVSEDSMRMALTARGRVVGTPGYMAPEQLRGEHLSPATDLYSVGIIALELMTGEPAFRSRNDFETAAMQLDASPLSIPDDIEMPQAARETLRRMLIKRASERLQDAQEAIEVLNQVIAQGGPAPAAELVLTQEAPAPLTGPTSAGPPKIVFVLAVGVALLIVVAAALAFLLR